LNAKPRLTLGAANEGLKKIFSRPKGEKKIRRNNRGRLDCLRESGREKQAVLAMWNGETSIKGRIRAARNERLERAAS